MVELRFLIVVLRYLGVDWDSLNISNDLKKNLRWIFIRVNRKFVQIYETRPREQRES